MMDSTDSNAVVGDDIKGGVESVIKIHSNKDATPCDLSSDDDLKSLVECPICLEPATDSRMLGCQHSFCLKCLSDHVGGTPGSKTFNCPVCREPWDIPEGGIDNQPKNIFLNNLSGIMNKKQASMKTEMVCSLDECEEQATHFCVDGCDFLCLTCSKFHSKVKGTKHHQVVNVDELDTVKEEKPSIPLCEKHPNNPVDFYCQKCECLLCGTCSFLEHQGHPCIILTDQPDEIRTELQQLIKKTKYCINTVKEAVEATQREKTATEKDFNILENQVMEMMMKLHAYIDNIKDKFIQKMTDIKKKVLKEVECVSENQCFLQTALESLYSYQTSVSVHG